MEWQVAKRNLKNSKQQLKQEHSIEGEDELVIQKDDGGCVGDDTNKQQVTRDREREPKQGRADIIEEQSYVREGIQLLFKWYPM